MHKSHNPHCQCSPQCAEPPLRGSPFCATHQKQCYIKAPLSGYEPVYNPARYNGKAAAQNSHNCFAYAFDVMDMPPPDKCNEKECFVPFHQPGRRSGYPRWSTLPDKRCPDVVSRIKADVPGVSMSSFTRRCPKGTSKIALVIDADQDYHFYRQDSNGYWSHKPGGTQVTNRDSTGRRIYNPQLASRDSGRLNYDVFCSFMCVPRKKTHTLKRGGTRSAKRTKSTRGTRARRVGGNRATRKQSLNRIMTPSGTYDEPAFPSIEPSR